MSGPDVMVASVGGTSLALVVTTGLTAVGAIVGAAISPFGDFLARKEKLKSYKRNIYRNFLDHGYWCLHGELKGERLRKREEKYIADWHRIQLITEDPEVKRLTGDIRTPEKFSDERAEELLEAFSVEIGSGGIE
jgi:hypothetical protein